MKISEQKYIELSQASFWLEIIVNGLFLVCGILSNIFTHYTFTISMVGIPLIIFNLLNIILKLSIFYKKISIEKYKLYSMILLILGISILILSLFSPLGMTLRSFIFLMFYKFNSKYNYFLKQK